MNISELKQSKFLTRGDVGRGVLVTIKHMLQVNVSKEGAPEEIKWAIEFVELEKPMICNSTNGQLIAQITKSDETDTWAGHKIVLYDDPTVSFGGKLVGGIRVRAPRLPAAPAPARPAPVHVQQPPATAPARPAPVASTDQPNLDPESDDVPF